MHYFIISSIVIMAIFFPGCMSMDAFLFNNSAKDSYELPGNTIADSLINEVKLDSDGYTLYGYWIESSGERVGITILYCHGNKDNIDEYWDRVMLLHKLGANIFIFDYRGFGRSEGETSEEGLYADGEVALDYVLSTQGVSPDSLCIYGYSLGNVVSIYLTARIAPPLCLIAEAPFASANSLTQSAITIDIPPLWLTDGEFDNAEKIRDIECPLLLFHGDSDDMVRYRDNGRIVFENAPEPKSLAFIEGANHDDIPDIMGSDNYLSRIEELINSSIENMPF